MEMELALVRGPSGSRSRESASSLSWTERAGLRALETAVRRWRGEALLLELSEGRVLELGDAKATLRHRIRVEDPRFFRRILWRADLGFGESYTAGEWSSSDLVGLLRAFVRQDSREDNWWRGSLRLLDQVRHRLNANTPGGSERNIRAHYDLGNEFYQAWLDPSMQYSCGIYPEPGSTLEQAQDLKLRTLIAKLQVEPGMHILEIGSGWGELAARLARDHGCHVTTVTLSREQHEWVRRRASECGMADRLDARLQDYREVRGSFQRIVSVEMIEAVGHENLPTYFRCLEALLAPGGHAVVQAITVPDQGYARYRRRTDWIQAHIFPGAVCPSISAVLAAMSRGSRLVLRQLEDLGPHYAMDLAHWRERFQSAWPRLRTLGFDERFQRLWTYYLCYCEAGFAQRKLGDVQMVLSRPGETSLPFFLPTSQGVAAGVRS